MANIVLTFSREAATVDAIQRAAYRFADRLSVDIRSEGTDWCCRLRPAPGVALEQHEVAHAFRTEVLDQMLRARIRDETGDERNVILALAFSNTDLVDRSR